MFRPCNNRLAFVAIAVCSVIGQYLPTMLQILPFAGRAFGCEECRTDAMCGDEHRFDINSIDQKLRIESELQIQIFGPPSSMTNLLQIVYANDPDAAEMLGSWQIPTSIDRMALKRAGIELDRIVIRPYYGVGVCRRSALRLILAKASLGYAVIGDGIVLTTKEIADSLGNSISDRPTVSGLTHNDVTVRRNNAFAAGNCRIGVNEFLAPLIAGLKDADRDVRFNSAYAIAAFGPDATDAVEDLIAMLVGDDFTLREVAKYSLSQLGQPAISPLLAAAEDLDQKNSEFAVRTLGDMGITGRAATEGLIGVATRHIAAELQIHGDDCAQCRAIAVAVAQVSTVGDRNSIRQLLTSKSPAERAFASYVVGDLGSSGMSFKEISSESVERELEELLLDQTVTVRRAAVRALATLDLQLETAMQLLEIASQDADHEVRIWATKALRTLKSK